MQLSIPALMIAFTVITIVTAGGLIRFRVTEDASSAVRTWVRGYALMALGTALLSVEPVIASPSLNVLSQSIIFAGTLHIPAALSLLRGRPIRRGIFIAAIAIFALVLAAANLSGNQQLIFLTISVFYIGICLSGTHALLTGESPRYQSLLERVMVFFFLSAGVSLATHGLAGFMLEEAEWATYQLMLVSIIAATGLTIGFHWLIHSDIEHHLETLNLQLKEQNERLSSFASAISHDLKSPLTAIQGNIELELLTNQELPESSRASLDSAMEATTRMNMMLDELLKWSRVDTVSVDETRTDCRQGIEAAMLNLDDLIASRNAEVTCFSHAAPVRCNSALLIHLLQNLLANAIKYCPAGRQPKIQITAIEHDKEFEITLTDNGDGIPEADQGRVFSMFKRGSNTNEVDGSGVGLAFCKTIVEKHGGRIWLAPSPEQGAEVHFRLPK